MKVTFTPPTQNKKFTPEFLMEIILNFCWKIIACGILYLPLWFFDVPIWITIVILAWFQEGTSLKFKSEKGED